MPPPAQARPRTPLVQPLAPRYRFDGYELDTTERLLYRDGQPVNLGARAIALLTALLARPGRLVTKAELLDRVWPGLVVEENNLQVQVSALRKVLGAHMIVTVPGRGYRFVQALQAEVVHAGDALGPPGLARPARAWHTHAAAEALAALPAGGARLLGRERELLALDDCLPAALITIVGPAGVGKTALALAGAHRWQADRAGGAFWIDLSSAQSLQQVVVAVAQGLNLDLGAAGAGAVAHLVDAMRSMKALVVLDHADAASAAVADWLDAARLGAPGVRWLVTCRAPLKAQQERVFALGPLSVPDADASLRDALSHGAIELFVEQVRAVDRAFELLPAQVADVTMLCRRVGGLPWSIQLVAACVPSLGLAGVWRKLADRFPSPVIGPSLPEVLDWALEWLSPAEQALLRRMSVFAGSVPLALVPVLGQAGPGVEGLDEWRLLDTLGGLVDRALVVTEAGSPPRHRLPDCVRERALARLEASGEARSLQRHHALAVADLLDAAYDTHWSSSDADWLARHAADIDDVRCALDWAAVHDPALAVRLMGAAALLFSMRGLASEARRRAEPLVDVASTLGGSPEATRFWLEASRLHSGMDEGRAREWARRAIDGARQLRDTRGVYLGLGALVGRAPADGEPVHDALRDMARLESTTWPARLLAQRQLAEVAVLRAQERMADARRMCQGLIVQAQAAGLDGVLSVALSDLAAICLALGDTDGAWRVSQHVLARSRHRRDPWAIAALAHCACVAFVRADLAQARASLAELVGALRSHGWKGLGDHAGLLALLAALEGRPEAAARVLGYADRQASLSGVRDVAAVYARTRALAAVEDALEPSVLRRLHEVGAQLDADAVVRWAFAHEGPGGP